MSAHPHTDEALLRRRAAYFFNTDRRARGEVREFAALLSTMGECAVVGGMLRDLCLGGHGAFRSDVDFVADVDDIDAFDRAMERMGATVNRFGGYGVKLAAWQVDVWPLQRTWAARKQHAEVRCLDDVLKTTFFDWDAVLYYPATGRVAAKEGYFGRLRDRVIDVNLLPNPNPVGNAVRALRYACRWQARLAPKLAEHVGRQVRDCGWDALLLAEERSFRKRHLRMLDAREIERRLAAIADGRAVEIVDAGQPRREPKAASKRAAAGGGACRLAMVGS
ncbi:hypothetical protein [Aureimonas pseudogalii]|uniref:Poly A polymerase head domain-containing protein n=1 Tax=Aureimonas pseudogalii TaxID=1744844 RepID=A0A7W6H4U8_9HYPH|nr:hypothetical protein [Aureimonas pseudogalii]MBB3998374.1 hypothetical protein [Aureimonas pseudogalii]